MTKDPFAVLGVHNDAEDEAIKQRYLALVRSFPRIGSRSASRKFARAYEAVRGRAGAAGGEAAADQQRGVVAAQAPLSASGEPPSTPGLAKRR